MVDYRKEMIEIVMQKKGKPSYKEPALAHVAYDANGEPLGLAYRKLETNDGLYFIFQVTHVPTGMRVGKAGTLNENRAKRWIDTLIELADWTGRCPAIVAAPLALLSFATRGVLSQLEDEEGNNE